MGQHLVVLKSIRSKKRCEDWLRTVFMSGKHGGITTVCQFFRTLKSFGFSFSGVQVIFLDDLIHVLIFLCFTLFDSTFYQ